MQDREDASGLAHLAAVSFLGARLIPSGGYWVALAGGVAVARAAGRHGLRAGYGASIAGLAQSVAIMGPARLFIPLTQATSAPLVGRLEARGAALGAQIAVAAAVRLALGLAGTAFVIWVILGGLDAYVGSYEWMTGWFEFLPEGEAGVLLLSVLLLALWTAFASPVQVLVYRRGMRRWPAGVSAAGGAGPAPAGELVRRRLDPRAVTGCAAIAFALLLVSTDWILLAAVAAWLVLASVVARPDRDFLGVGAVLAAFLGAIAFGAGMLAGLGLEVSLERAARAVLLVSVATWFRGAAGTGGIREVSRRVLGRLRRVVPGAQEAARMLGDLGSGAALLPTARALGAELRHVRRRPLPVVDAVVRWAAAESRRFRAAPPVPPPRLALGPGDLGLLLLAAAPGATLLLGLAVPGSA